MTITLYYNSVLNKILKSSINITILHFNTVVLMVIPLGLARGFFRELGQKVLKLIDVLIAKIESKQQKYK